MNDMTGWCGKGWDQILIDADAKLKYIDPNYTILQIKEKFGTLRYYISTERYGDGTPAGLIMDDIITCAELASERICENCGGWNGVETKALRGWYKTYCPDCFKDMEAKYAKQN